MKLKRGIVMICSMLVSSMFFFGGSVFACPTCSGAPSDLQTYFSVMDKLLSLLNIPPSEQDPGNTIEEEAKEIMLGSKIALQSTLTVLTITAILPVEVFTDVGGDMVLLLGSQARRRDREKLVSYDEKISMKALTLAQNGLIGKDFGKENLDKINNELQKLGYVELNKIGGTYITPLLSANYEDILTMYWLLNSVYKKIHRWKKWYQNDLGSVGSEFIVKDDLRKNETIESPEREALQKVNAEVKGLVEGVFKEQKEELRGNSVDWLVFKNDYRDFTAAVWQIQSEYACAVGIKNQCENEWKSTVKESWENTKGRTSDLQKSMKTFAEARARLRGTFGKGDQKARDAAKQREEALLNSIYGGDIPKKRAWWDLTDTVVGLDIENQSQDIKALGSWLRKTFKEGGKKDTLTQAQGTSNISQDASQEDPNKYATKEDKKAAMDKYKKEVVTSRRLDQEIEIQGVFAGQKRELKEKAIRDVFTDTLLLQQDREQQLVFQDTRSATRQFPKLSAAVWQNKAIRGDKNEPNDVNPSIYNSAGKICELQCSNIQGKCRYHTN